MRPKSIIQFEWVYIAVILIGIASSALSWNDMMATVQVQQMVARFGMAMVWIPLAIGILLQIAFLYFIARRGSVVVKWIFVVLTGLGVVWSAFAVATQGAPNAIEGVLTVTQIVLQVVAIVLVFRPDTPPWFGEDEAADNIA